ncbi:hypothetical protein FRB98_003675 [Tulasnella sp. 332]|nr:hypothetical protein FRB98_003675 [Tulasnella sp. 332]
MAQVASSPRPPSRTSSIRSPSPLVRQGSQRASTATTAVGSSARSSRSQSITEASPAPQSPPPTRQELDLTTPSRPPRSSRRKSSYETLVQISSAKDSSFDSFIPIPARTFSAPDTSIESIREGVPLEINVKSHDRESSSPPGDGRPMTPTRTISRNARALAEDGRPRSVSPLPSTPMFNGDTTLGDTSLDLPNTSSSSLFPTTPSTPGSSNAYKRLSMGPGGTSKVLSDLQTAAVQARSALENTRAQLRLSQRSVGSLTRQVEDLKDGRERLRLENENLNNVVARKERLLQEVLERARKAEAEVLKLKTDLKTEISTAKKASATVQEAVVTKDRAENEYKVLRDSIAAMKQSWKDEVKQLRDDMKKKDEAWKEEVKEIEVKYNSLLKLTRASNAERSRRDSIKTEIVTLDSEFEQHIRSELSRLAKDVDRSTGDTDGAHKKADQVAEELARLKRLMRTAGSTSRHEGG